jgi:small subunit ribosomal protein S5
MAVEKAVKDANRNMMQVQMLETTIPHEVVGKFGAARVLLVPARAGTGIIAGNAVRAVVEAAGIRDILTKNRGSSNPINVVKAVFAGLGSIRPRHEVARLRGVEV